MVKKDIGSEKENLHGGIRKISFRLQGVQHVNVSHRCASGEIAMATSGGTSVDVAPLCTCSGRLRTVSISYFDSINKST